VDSLQNFSRGVPRLINLVADASLAMGFREQKHIIQPALVHQAAASLGLGLPAAPTSGRSVDRRAVWQMPSPQSELIREGTVDADRLQVRERTVGSQLERIEGGSPVGSVMIFGNNSATNAEDEVAQKTAVDRLIDAMRQSRTRARGAR